QRQRIALARALAIEPRILLLDEPFGALDAKVRKELRQWLRSLHQEIHVTSIFVTHDQEEALEVANRVVVMDKGRIEQVGTPGDVYDNPATAFVHGFIGESIVLGVEVRDGSVQLGGKPLNIKANGYAPGAAKLFIRRHAMQIGPAGSGALEGSVKHVRTFGPIQRAEVALCGPAEKTVIEIDAPRDRELQPGDTVSLQPRRYRIFAAQECFSSSFRGDAKHRTMGRPCAPENLEIPGLVLRAIPECPQRVPAVHFSAIVGMQQRRPYLGGNFRPCGRS